MYVQKAVIMDGASMDRSLMRIAHELVERNAPCDGICIVGIRRRGVPLARQIAANIESFSDVRPLVGELDIGLYRDDLTEMSEQALVNETDIGFDVVNRVIVLVDDVLYTGRTARAAVEAIIKRGRPAAVQLAVLIDRGHRELPIRHDFVGKNVPTSRREMIEVRVPEYDGVKEVAIMEHI